MSLTPARGTALRTHVIKTRFAGALPGRRTHNFDVTEVRRLLRTDMSIEQIATHLGGDAGTLRNFIRRRALCNLKARRDFISLQESLRKQEGRPLALNRFKAREL